MTPDCIAPDGIAPLNRISEKRTYIGRMNLCGKNELISVEQTYSGEQTYIGRANVYQKNELISKE